MSNVNFVHLKGIGFFIHREGGFFFVLFGFYYFIFCCFCQITFPSNTTSILIVKNGTKNKTIEQIKHKQMYHC